jgi:riboflavin kinase/FMN adenylyltransferase
MRILRSIPELAEIPGPIFLAIGVFDGVHLGHQAVILTAAHHAADAGGTAVVVTFDPHPMKILRPQASPRLITATQHKIALIRDLGVSHLLVIKFDREFAATPPADFVKQLVSAAHPLRGDLCRSGMVLRERSRGQSCPFENHGAELGFNVVGVEP